MSQVPLSEKHAGPLVYLAAPSVTVNYIDFQCISSSQCVSQCGKMLCAPTAPIWLCTECSCNLTATVMTSSSSLPPNPTPSPRGNPSQQLTGVESSSSGEAVGIAVSTAAGTVIAVAVLVIVGVGLCWAIHNGYMYAQYLNQLFSYYTLQ